MATTPSPALIGVKRIVVACELGSNFTQAQRQSICQQLVRKASQVTALPVAIATSADLDPLGSARVKDQLLLRVDATFRDVGTSRKTVTLKVTPVRLARPQGQMAAQTSTASLARVQDRWVLQGPISAFNKLLGSTRGRGLRAPVTSDRN